MTTLLRASEGYTLGFNPPTPTGGPDLLGDTNGTTYLDFAPGGYNTTVGIATPGVGETVEAPISMHLFMHVRDPDGFPITNAAPDTEITGEIFLNTQSDGSSGTEFAGFSDGAGSGFAFNLPTSVLNGPAEFSIPLNLSPWPGTALADVVAALEAGCWLDFNAWSWLAGSTFPQIRVYEAWIVAGSDEEPVVASKLRLYPRDDVLGFGGVARQYPPPRRGRLYGQQP